VKKVFRIAADAVRPVAEGYGACLASDRITVDGLRVGYLYREEPDFADDSGWRFFAGDETPEYASTPDHFELYDVNTIANYDEEIVDLLDMPPGMAFIREDTGEFVPVPFDRDEE